MYWNLCPANLIFDTAGRLIRLRLNSLSVSDGLRGALLF
jgi:hypothetical protein